MPPAKPPDAGRILVRRHRAPSFASLATPRDPSAATKWSGDNDPEGDERTGILAARRTFSDSSLPPDYRPARSRDRGTGPRTFFPGNHARFGRHRNVVAQFSLNSRAHEQLCDRIRDMSNLDRRSFVAAAALIGAVPAIAGTRPRRSALGWQESAARFPQGVASGDPTPDSVLLWTRRQPMPGDRAITLTVELAEDEGFETVVATRRLRVDASTDWTCRVLMGALLPSRTYWYRFLDHDGAGSRIGRTRTAPADTDGRDVRFAVVSCQNANLGPLTAWRRMVHDDRANPTGSDIEFVLHLGDFVYETVWYPEDRPDGYFDRRVRDVVRFPQGERHDDFHVPVTLEDYRTLYRNYLADADLQAARARWPFVAIWDNGEYSNDGWQAMQRYGTSIVPAQTRKVAANQAWFEFLPSRARAAGGTHTVFRAPKVSDVPVRTFDSHGFGQEPNNIAAVASLTGYRAQRWGRHVELLLTDQRSYRSLDYTASPGARAIASKRFPQLVPFESLEMIDAGRTWQDGNPPDELQFGDGLAPNFRRDATPRTLLGMTQKHWLLERLSVSRATWKVWANTLATFDMRADPHHLPPGLGAPWPGKGYAGFARTDHSTAYAERGEILDHIAHRAITGFVTLSGDRHSFWAGYSAKALPPAEFAPVGINFVVGSISSPGMVEALEYVLPKVHPLRSLYLVDTGAPKPEPTVNLLLRHGVRSCLDYAEGRDIARAKQLADPDNAPHVEFVDMGGHGYGIARASATRFEVEFVCIERPVHDSGAHEGAPVRYRATHAAERWHGGQQPRLQRTAATGDLGLSG
jgi:alkaline phosphatase D